MINVLPRIGCEFAFAKATARQPANLRLTVAQSRLAYAPTKSSYIGVIDVPELFIVGGRAVPRGGHHQL